MAGNTILQTCAVLETNHCQFSMFTSTVRSSPVRAISDWLQRTTAHNQITLSENKTLLCKVWLTSPFTCPLSGAIVPVLGVYRSRFARVLNQSCLLARPKILCLFSLGSTVNGLVGRCLITLQQLQIFYTLTVYTSCKEGIHAILQSSLSWCNSHIEIKFDITIQLYLTSNSI